MGLELDVNSYVDVTGADEYFLTRYGASAIWDALGTAEKESALLSAMPLLESYCSWSGEKTDPEQPLEFPRNGDTEVPAYIKNGQCELAFNVVQAGGPSAVSSAPIKKLKADTAEIEWMDSYTQQQVYYNDLVTTFLNPYCTPGTEGMGSNGSQQIIRV